MTGTGERLLVTGAAGLLGQDAVRQLLSRWPDRQRWPAAKAARPVVFLDFDGTITRRDVTDAILEVYADPQWLQVEEEWKAGRLSSRDCLTAQVALVTAAPEQLDSLLDSIEIDSGLVPLLDTCSAHGVPVHIVSDGFDYCIHRVLSRPSLGLAPHLESVQIVSSHLERDGTRWTLEFTSSHQPCAHGCATCKPATMERLNPAGGPMVFVGDGLSDKHAARRADLVFAKDALAAFCDQHAIAYAPYDHLLTVAQSLDRLLQSTAVLALEPAGGAAD
jgi:2,3-diketo-5-methylthio-1-phosphopentane phosphatase